MSDQAASHAAPAPIAPSISPVVSNSSGGSPVEDGAPAIDPQPQSNGKTSSQSEQQSSAASKTDKPRPHVCGTCSRSFARLEHLKRHERSHTKEKPFECPECTRCFARRDLLLRHQQKLHMGAAASTKNRTVRRESTSALGPNMSNKVRKNSMASNSSSGSAIAGMRPRANTISHIDGTTLGMLAAANRSVPNPDFGSGQGQHLNGSRGGYDPSGFNGVDHGHMNPHNLPRLATTGLPIGLDNGLRTAPPMNGSMNFDTLFSSGSTINPAHLHLGDSLANSASPNGRHFAPFSANGAIMEEDDNLDWMRGFNAQMSFGGLNEQVLADSPPSISNGIMSDNSIDISNGLHANGFSWPNDSLQNNGHMPHQFPTDQPGSASEFSRGPEMVSPKTMAALSGTPDNLTFTTQSPLANGVFQNVQNGYQPHMALSSDGNSISSSVTGSARQSSITSVSTDSITDVTRQALLMSLSQPSCFGHNTRKYSQPPVSSPLSPRDSSKASGVALPSTFDLQRYVNAYIQYFHPHFPFLHIPTLSFDSPAFTTLRAMPSGPGYTHTNIIGGGGCLILAMAAIGALYEYEKPASRDLFEAAKKMIQLYLEERRKAELSTASNSPGSASDLAAQNTPLWLVQAMLLNVIYGHNCGDKTVGEIASTHCSALVSLARAAELNIPIPTNQIPERTYSNGSDSPANGDVHMHDDNGTANGWNGPTPTAEEQAQWHQWIFSEERKRTLFAIFHLSSILVSAYNHAPALMNSEIQLELPCDEDMWNAESARAWISKGGLRVIEQRAIPFSAALGMLLTAANSGQRDPSPLMMNRPFGSGIPLSDVPDSQLKPSTFGCLVLINALHNYIWETRQRHTGRIWTTQETESMHAHIEPALRAWQSAWASNPTHSLERPNPYGQGPLSADCIPLLDLAYVRLFVNLGTSKEAFWQRDFDAMAEELARGAEIIQHADSEPGNGAGQSVVPEPQGGDSPGDVKIPRTPTRDYEDVAGLRTAEQERSSKRERHLRKAAFYAADSLSMSDKIGVTFADFTSKELPLQSALCTFDCAQVLAEWVSTVQERVGRYLGILGQSEIDYSQVPAVMLLEDEDCRLLEKIADILAKVEAKMTFDIAGMPGSAAMTAMHNLSSVSQRGYGSKILAVTAYMLQRAAVWPVTSIMSQGLEVQAVHMNNRAENSLLAR